MRKEMRFESNDDYWNRRWSEAEHDTDFKDLTVYPIKYAERVVRDSREYIAELGCGLGRVLKHYDKRGYDVIGIEKSKVAVETIRNESGNIPVFQMDVKRLRFPDNSFDVILAFGLYHNIEIGMVDAIKESLRCLKSAGRFCISMRPDNIEMRLNQLYWNMKNKKGKKCFHKWLIKENEFQIILNNLGCHVEKIFYSRNVSTLWRIPFLRVRKTESERRNSGYELNKAGKLLDSTIMYLFPKSFCNVMVFIGCKNG